MSFFCRAGLAVSVSRSSRTPSASSASWVGSSSSGLLIRHWKSLQLWPVDQHAAKLPSGGDCTAVSPGGGCPSARGPHRGDECGRSAAADPKNGARSKPQRRTDGTILDIRSPGNLSVPFRLPWGDTGAWLNPQWVPIRRRSRGKTLRGDFQFSVVVRPRRQG